VGWGGSDWCLSESLFVESWVLVDGVCVNVGPKDKSR
jgi:hypothetical protein